MSYSVYPAYKDSGVEWLGDVPEHWKVLRLKRSSALFNNKIIPTGNVKYIGLEHVESWTGKMVHNNTEDKPTGTSNIFEPKQVLFGKLRPYLAKSYLTDEAGVCSSEFLVLKGIHVEPAYLHYYTLTDEFIKQVDASTYGAKMPRASWDFISLMFQPVPSTEEQTAIANFLDRETAKIDTLITKQQELIKLLQEKRQAVISHAVTKGLNPDAPMKDSGVEWLGEVPEHWELPKLIHRTSKIGDGLHSTPQYEDGTGYYFVNGNNLVDGSIMLGPTAKEVPEEEYKKHYIHLGSNSVLLSINGTIGNVARYNAEQVILGKSAAYMNCANALLPEYLMCYLQTSQLFHYYDLEVTGTTIFNLSLNSIRQMKVCVPPKHEQKEIELYCIKQKKKYEVLINKANQSITLLQERRNALISSAVTGKIDVRQNVREAA